MQIWLYVNQCKERQFNKNIEGYNVLQTEIHDLPTLQLSISVYVAVAVEVKFTFILWQKGNNAIWFKLYDSNLSIRWTS